MRISDWSSDVCSSDLIGNLKAEHFQSAGRGTRAAAEKGQVEKHHDCEAAPLRVIVYREASSRNHRDHAEGHDSQRVENTFVMVKPIPTAEQQAGNRQHQRSEEHTSELQSLMRISYAVFCWTKKIYNNTITD